MFQLQSIIDEQTTTSSRSQPRCNKRSDHAFSRQLFCARERAVRNHQGVSLKQTTGPATRRWRPSNVIHESIGQADDSPSDSLVLDGTDGSDASLCSGEL